MLPAWDYPHLASFAAFCLGYLHLSASLDEVSTTGLQPVSSLQQVYDVPVCYSGSVFNPGDTAVF